MPSIHIPILLEKIVPLLLEPFLSLPEEAPPHWLIDCTLGGGGHTASFLKAFQIHPFLKKHKVLALDQDPSAVSSARERFRDEIKEGNLEIIQCRFGEVQLFVKNRFILCLFADLGISSDQLKDLSRGFSFQGEGLLDMRIDPTRGISCMDWLRGVSESELERVLREYGEERFSKRIASLLIENRRQGLLPRTSKELVDIVVRAVPYGARHGRIHIATRTFQALRIAVNNEMEQLDSLLKEGVESIQEGGRVAILSFHSLEDRKVKQRFKSRRNVDGSQDFLALTKKPLQVDPQELLANPASRSAKLRIAERCYVKRN